MFGDSQLLIRFMLRIYKKPQRHTIYWAVEDVKRAERDMGGPVAYRHVTREANCVADDMARRALEAKADITFWSGDIPEGAPANQVGDVYAQQGTQPQLDWSAMPKPVAWGERIPKPPSVGALFGTRFAECVRVLTLQADQAAASARLRELVGEEAEGCLASLATDQGVLARLRRCLEPRVCPTTQARRQGAGDAPDERPCMWCGDASD